MQEGVASKAERNHGSDAMAGMTWWSTTRRQAPSRAQRRSPRRGSWLLATGVALGLLAAACGGDDSGSGASSAETGAPRPPTSAATDTAATATPEAAPKL